MRGRKSLTDAWFEMARDSIALMQGSAVVIGKRTAAMAAAGPNPPVSQRREMLRMVEEKASASAESMTKIAFASAAAYQSIAMSTMLGRPPGSAELQRAAIQVLGAASAPYRTKVRGNVKRLGRK